MGIKVSSPPKGFYKRYTYGSESGARKYRKAFLRFNAGQFGTNKINPDDVVICYNPQNNDWEVWVKGN